ncbi:MAG: lactoylglutathione lyase [Proteobacteria bacterium]|nr:MAG: lactoylglutathione lyase [Pseudomonadota bacterium]
MKNPVSWFEIYVQDMQRARTFYEKVLEIELSKIPSDDLEMWGFPMIDNAYGAGGALAKMEACPSGGGGTLVYLFCQDCGAAAVRAQENGGRIFKDKFSIGKEGFIALIVDTEGNIVGLHSYQ